MMNSKISFLMACAVIGLLMGTAHAQLLPNTICQTCTNLFRSNGCPTTANFFCRILATKLNFQVGQNIRLCNQYPCVGYGAPSANACTTLLGCPIASIDTNGICSTGLTCCTNPR